MIITAKQAQMMIALLRDSLKFVDNAYSPFILSQEARAKLYEEIINQQDERLKNIGE